MELQIAHKTQRRVALGPGDVVVAALVVCWRENLVRVFCLPVFTSLYLFIYVLHGLEANLSTFLPLQGQV